MAKIVQIAIAQMQNALDEIVIDGIKTNISLHQKILTDPQFIEGGTHIHHLTEMIAKES